MYYGLYIAGYGNGRFFGFHGWHRAHLNNHTAYQYYTLGGSNSFSGSDFEGSDQAGAYIGEQRDKFDSTDAFYATQSGGAVNLIVAGNNNVVDGMVSCYSAPTGLQLSGAGNIIGLSVSSCTSGAVNFISGEGLNQVIVNATQSTGQGYAGTPNSNDTFLFTDYGATSNKSINLIPGL